MHPLEVMAVLVSVAVLAKILFLVFNPHAWVHLAKIFLKHAAIMRVVYLLLAVLVGYYVFQYLHVVEVAAVVLLVSLIMGMTWLEYPKQMLSVVQDISKADFLRTSFFTLLLWAAFAVWVLASVLNF